MKKIITSLLLAGIIASPLALFAADATTTAPLLSPTTTSITSLQEKALAKKLSQLKRKSKDTKQKIKTNLSQTKNQISKVKKERAKVKKTRAKKGITQTTGGVTALPGEHCGGNMTTAHTCSVGYYCAPVAGSHLPFGDVGGTCVKN